MTALHKQCGQCGFGYARVEMETWAASGSRRVMCPVCGWTRYEEREWQGETATITRHNESKGYGAFRLIPPGGYSCYNAFNKEPSQDVLRNIENLLLNEGWNGYLSLWDDEAGKAYLVVGSPLQKFDETDTK